MCVLNTIFWDIMGACRVSHGMLRNLSRKVDRCRKHNKWFEYQHRSTVDLCDRNEGLQCDFTTALLQVRLSLLNRGDEGVSWLKVVSCRKYVSEAFWPSGISTGTVKLAYCTQSGLRSDVIIYKQGVPRPEKDL